MKAILYEAVEADEPWDLAATVAVPASSMNRAAPSMTFVKRWRMNASSCGDGKPETRFRCLLIRRASPEVKPSARQPELPSTPGALPNRDAGWLRLLADGRRSRPRVRRRGAAARARR